MNNWITWTTVIKMNFLLFLLPLSFVMLWWKGINRQIGKYMVIPLPFMLFMAKGSLFGYYFTLIIPFLAVISSYFLLEIVKHRLGAMILVGFVVMSIGVIGIFNYQSTYAMPLNLTIEPNRIVTGDPPLSAYISLNQGNNVLNNDVDNNNMIYYEGLKNITQYINDIITNNALLIIRKHEGLDTIKIFKKFINQCTLLYGEHDYQLFQLFDCSNLSVVE